MYSSLRAAKLDWRFDLELLRTTFGGSIVLVLMAAGIDFEEARVMVDVGGAIVGKLDSSVATSDESFWGVTTVASVEGVWTSSDGKMRFGVIYPDDSTVGSGLFSSMSMSDP